MFIIIRGKNVPVTAELQRIIERQLLFALDRVSSEIQRVDVRLEDMNGPRGGIDKRCLILLRWNRGGLQITSHTAIDLPRAVAGATEKLSGVIGHVTDRHHDYSAAARSRRPRRTGTEMI